MTPQEKKLARKLKIASIKNTPLKIQSTNNNYNDNDNDNDNDKTPTNIEKYENTPTPT